MSIYCHKCCPSVEPGTAALAPPKRDKAGCCAVPVGHGMPICFVSGREGFIDLYVLTFLFFGVNRKYLTYLSKIIRSLSDRGAFARAILDDLFGSINSVVWCLYSTL